METRKEVSSRIWDKEARKALFGEAFGNEVAKRTTISTRLDVNLGLICRFEFTLTPGAEIGIEGIAPNKKDLDTPDEQTKDIIQESAKALAIATRQILLDYGTLQKSFLSRLKFLFTGGIKTIHQHGNRR